VPRFSLRAARVHTHHIYIRVHSRDMQTPKVLTYLLTVYLLLASILLQRERLHSKLNLELCTHI